MEICNSVPRAVNNPHCFTATRATPYALHQPYDLSSQSINTSLNTPSPYFSYPSYGHSALNSNSSNHDVISQRTQLQSRSAEMGETFYGREQLGSITSVSAINPANAGFRPYKPFNANRVIQAGPTINYMETSSTESVGAQPKPAASWKDSTKSEVETLHQALNKHRTLMDPNQPDLLLHHVQSSSSHWDVNDPKLPRIRQFDTFTLWSQGNCRFAYLKSSSDGARRHASGWAMRNTNNHNSQILKKSCLGVLLCTAKTCTLAMRPAICDKARRRQEGRPCCMPNCTGRVYNQPCRGHGGYPVTHFWREQGETVYFQSKGTHDHVRPDLKPVRDTAARRRRQLQRDSAGSREVTRGGRNGSVETRPIKKMMRFRGEEYGTVYGSVIGQTDKNATLELPLGKQAKLENGDDPFSNGEWPASCGNMTKHIIGLSERATSTSTAEPIFPASPSFSRGYTDDYQLKLKTPLREETDNSFTPFSSSLVATTSSSSSILPTTTLMSSNHKLLSTFYSLNTPSGMKSSQPYLFDEVMKTDHSIQYDHHHNHHLHHNPQQLQHSSIPTIDSSQYGPFLKDLYEPFVKNEDSAYLFQNPSDQIQPQSIGAVSLFKYQQQYQSSSMFQAAGNMSLGGGNSESTSGGLNASWSTPSPPTLGGSSSLFGSEFRTDMSVPPFSLNGQTEINNLSHYTSLVLPNWSTGNSPPTTTTATTTSTSTALHHPILFGQYEQSPTDSIAAPSFQTIDPFTTITYSLATPTHSAYTSMAPSSIPPRENGVGQEHSPESLLSSTLLIHSTSTPVSNNQTFANRLTNQLNQATSNAYTHTPVSINKANFMTPVTPFNLTPSSLSNSHSSRVTDVSSTEAGESGSSG